MKNVAAKKKTTKSDIAPVTMGATIPPSTARSASAPDSGVYPVTPSVDEAKHLAFLAVGTLIEAMNKAGRSEVETILLSHFMFAALGSVRLTKTVNRTTLNRIASGAEAYTIALKGRLRVIEDVAKKYPRTAAEGGAS